MWCQAKTPYNDRVTPDNTTPEDLEAAFAANPGLRERLASFQTRLENGEVEIVPHGEAVERVKKALARGSLKPPDPEDGLELKP